jgi:two-component system, NtrC family, response regulator HydG
MDTMAEGVFILDASCCIMLWNRAMAEMTGWRATEMEGKPCSELLCTAGGNQPPELDCALLRHVDGKEAVHRLECMLQARDGDTIPVVKNARILTDEAEQPIGVVVTLTDLRPLRRLEEDLAVMRHEAAPTHGMGRLVGKSHAMQRVYDRICPAGDSDVTVLIEGETGTGKELAAEAIHAMGARKEKPLVKVNCSALSENLLESELFGHVKGAFTGAIKDKVGRIEMAEGGTLFLDEIGDISPLIQLKLLRVLQEHEYERVGESTPRKADVRFVAATHRNLKQRVQEGAFREDFYYRIRVFSIAMPPLREHKEDIPLLCDTFIQKLNRSTGKQIAGLSHKASHGFMDYCWPGNVRELENAIEHAFVTCVAETIELDDIPFEIRTASQRAIECQERGGQIPILSEPSEPLTRERLLETLQACNGNQSETARRLRIDRTTVWRKMKVWSIEPTLPA